MIEDKLNSILDWETNKPSTDKDWAEDVKEESLHLKFDYQLAEMEAAHTAKIPEVEEEIYKLEKYPGAVKYELELHLKERISEEELEAAIEEEFQSQHTYCKWKKAKLEQSVERIKKERELRKNKLVTRNPIGTTYYIDFDNGHDVNNDGSTPTKSNGDGPWATLDKFTENARSAGDICIVRGSMTQGVSSDLLFTSPGVISGPIIIKRDYGDEWSDHVDLSGTETATLTFGSKTVTYGGDISGVLAAGDWIYVSGDDNTDHAYEVESISGGSNEVATLFLPYKGGQAGSGKTTYNMGDNPTWNTAAGDYQVMWDADHYWFVQGIYFRGTDANGVVEMDDSDGLFLKDCIMEGNGAGDYGIGGSGTCPFSRVEKCRLYNYVRGINGVSQIVIVDCFLDGNSVTNSRGLATGSSDFMYAYETEFKNHDEADLRILSHHSEINCRNVILGSATETDGATSEEHRIISVEDYDGTIGDSRRFTSRSTSGTTPIYQSDTGTVRTGGGATSIKLTPSTELGTVWPLSRVELFELPLYATTSSKTYTVYFNLPAANFTAAPSAIELWIELEAWGHASNNFRKITKSTGTVAADGTWDPLTVTVAPAQAGVAYLRCYYAKTKEDGKDNIFYTDPIPVIT